MSEKLDLDLVVEKFAEKYPVDEGVKEKLRILIEEFKIPLPDAVKMVKKTIKPVNVADLRNNVGKYVNLNILVVQQRAEEVYVVADSTGYAVAYSKTPLEVGKVYHVRGAYVGKRVLFLNEKTFKREVDLQIELPEVPRVRGTVTAISVKDGRVRVQLSDGNKSLGWYDLPVEEVFDEEKARALRELGDDLLIKAILKETIYMQKICIPAI